jgi:zinc transport system substrate-binding protein
MPRSGRARVFVIWAASAVGLVLCSCETETSGGDDERLHVVVTVAPLAGLVDRIAPEISNVTVMIPAAASPVTYEPSLSRVRAASTAGLYVSVGHPAFAWETTWLAGLLRRGEVPIISSADGCDVLPDDPHVWLSLPCARSIAERIASAVQRARPATAESVAASLAALLVQMDAMRRVADSSLGPHRGGSFIALHPAWGYLAREYDLQQMAILDHGSGDAGPAELAMIVERGRARGLVNVIVQPQFSVEAARLVANELGGETVTLDPLARDWPASFGDAVAVLVEQVRP